ncbi:ABC-2 type transport system permease protein [Mobilisporobacter senegalensis]|uniref:ABC-2 type transport system permease protein n=1 Tax=Mobilisporobacter senegalensis TaxID=1329262 RepID=A0A3N1X7Z5_9FIRM|nr:ABC-2 family transporter protein [Mobilisporobacter senegalensis]ROR22098.1 ABC-2 type transport system permease protein [Mobilisporobacter senegalensis]
MDNKRGLGFYIHLYKIILTQDLKSKMSYRADFIISTIGMVFTNVSGFITFWILFQNFPSIAGWNYYEMLFLYGFSLLALTPVQCFFDNNWNLRSHIYTGDFIKYCLRPINLFFYYMSEVFDMKGIGQFFFGTGTLYYAWNKLGIPFTLKNLILLIISFISASLFMIALMNLAAATNFWLMGSTFVMIFAFKFKDYARYPVKIFSRVFRFIFTFIIPIAFVAYYPSLFFLKPDEIPPLTYLSPFLGMIFFYISYKVWMKGALSYSGTGS